MAKKSRLKSKSVAPTPAPPTPLVIDPFGQTKTTPIKKQKIQTSTFLLSDGTKLLIRPRLSDVRRAVGQFNRDGQPLYFITLGHAITTKAPARLVRKVPKLKKP